MSENQRGDARAKDGPPRSDGSYFTGGQIQGRLQALAQEWERTGGFDQERLREFLQKLSKQDPGHTRPARGQAPEEGTHGLPR